MLLRLIRNPSNETCTIGNLYVNGVWECFILEDPVRPTKIAGRTAIPAGRYKVTITHSPRFNRPLPLVHDVPGFSGIRIHTGNTAEDTEGCLLPGLTNPSPFSVGSSGKAFNALYEKLSAASKSGETVWLEVS